MSNRILIGRSPGRCGPRLRHRPPGRWSASAILRARFRGIDLINNRVASRLERCQLLGGRIRTMPILPAVCDSCSTLFNSGFRVENSRHITIEDFTTGPCPRCGGRGHIPDGVYDVVGDTIRVLATTTQSAEALVQLARVLERARASGAQDPGRVAASIEKESPEFSALADVLRRLRGVRLIEWVTMALAVIAILQGAEAAQSNTRNDAKLDRIYNMLVQEQKSTSTPVTTQTPPPRAIAKLPGRNDPCWCGSGLKFKRCHGR